MDNSTSNKKDMKRLSSSQDEDDVVVLDYNADVSLQDVTFKKGDRDVNPNECSEFLFTDTNLSGFSSMEADPFFGLDGVSPEAPGREQHFLSNEGFNPDIHQVPNPNGSMKYVCQFCSRKFDRVSNLKRHLLLHTGSKPFQCLYCEYRAIQKVNVVQHMANKHKNEMNILMASNININDILLPKT